MVRWNPCGGENWDVHLEQRFGSCGDEAVLVCVGLLSPFLTYPSGGMTVVFYYSLLRLFFFFSDIASDIYLCSAYHV